LENQTDLVGRDGSIDWLCWPRFDSAACFAALLGTSENGRWLIAPKLTPVSTNRRYRPGTLILETEFETDAGSATIIDFMPPADGADLVRIIVGRAGRVIFETELVLRFNYGANVPWVNRLDDGTLNAIAGPERWAGCGIGIIAIAGCEMQLSRSYHADGACCITANLDHRCPLWS